MKKVILLSTLCAVLMFNTGANAQVADTPKDTTLYTDAEVTELLRNMPNVEVGKGVSFSSKDNKYKLTMRLRLQGMVGVTLDDDWGVSRFRLERNKC